VLHLRVYGTEATTAKVAERLTALSGVRHVVCSGGGVGEWQVSADVGTDAADLALDELDRLAVPREDIDRLRLESIGPGIARRSLTRVVWADLLSQAGTNARPLGRFVVLMAMAGVVAGFGVIYANTILIVGAMAISPDTLPITATCTGLVLRRWRLAAKAFATLVLGLAVAGVVAGVMTAVIDAAGLLPDTFDIHTGVVQGLETVNVSTPLVALAAGVVGILSLETRASSAVGVAISVTTIPASAYFAVALAVGELDEAFGALAVLSINVAMLIVSGSATLLFQRRIGRRDAIRAATGRAQAPARSSRARTGRAGT
jgi:uncharacterized hydrophobic protein (TIGR00271 family)